MPALTVADVKHAMPSDDGALTSISFTTKYVGDLDVTMPSACIDRLIAMLQDARGRLRPAASPAPNRSSEPAAVTPQPPPVAPPKPTPEPETPLQPNQVRVTVPKTWAITTDNQQRGLVIVVFDHQAETRAGYALSPDAARKMSGLRLAKNAEAVLSEQERCAG